MKYSLIAYKDIQLGSFNAVFAMDKSKEDATEIIKAATIKGKIEDAESFEAYFLGVFDSETGSITLTEKELICDLKQYVRKD